MSNNILQSGERSVRSVFVGNIPYDATEEKLKDIFNEVGPVVSFRLVYDRETGKPKGYGFCEYRDQETAMSAMRNLNGYELNNRVLRVDNAANEKTKEEIRNLQTSINGIFESPYGPEIDPETAPEEISKVVASLPPEQMFELAKQMKQCIATNPTEAKNMLIQNPQLCYGLLQALVVMRVVDSNVALKMLHRQNPQVKALKLPPQEMPMAMNQIPPSIPSLANAPPQLPPSIVPPQLPATMGTGWPSSAPDQFGRAMPPSLAMAAAVTGMPPAAAMPNLAPSSVISTPSTQTAFDPRVYRMQNLPANNMDPRVRAQPQLNQPPPQTAVNPLDPRQFSAQQNNANRAAATNPNSTNRNTGPQPFNPMPTQPTPSSDDQEKTRLIMQVLQLTDSQIASLQPEHRDSVLMLRQQIQANNNVANVP